MKLIKIILLCLVVFMVGCVPSKRISVDEYRIFDKKGSLQISEGKNAIGQIIENRSPWVNGFSYLDGYNQMRSSSIQNMSNNNILEVYDSEGPIGSIEYISHSDERNNNIFILRNYLDGQSYRSKNIGRLGSNVPIEILDKDGNKILVIRDYGNGRWMIINYSDLSPDLFLHIMMYRNIN